MKKCYDCTHVEMCGWRKEVEEQGCEFFGDGIGWIPVSELLPERGKDVLVTRKYYGKDDCTDDCIYVEVSACYADGEEWYGFSDDYKMNPRNHKVIAWMPLPEPYKGGDTE